MPDFIWMNGYTVRAVKGADGLYDLSTTLPASVQSALAAAIASAMPVALDSALDLTLLASQARATAAAVASSDQINIYGVRGAMVFLNVTVAGGALKTLQMDVQARDPVSGNYINVGSTGVIGATVTLAGLYMLMVYPGAASLFSGLFAGNAVFPRTWRVRVTANDATSWTYSVGASLLQ